MGGARRRLGGPGAVVLLALLGGVGGRAPDAVAAPPARQPTPSASSAAAAGAPGAAEAEPDADQVLAALRQAQALRTTAQDDARDVAQARASVAASAADAALALESYARAAQVRDTAAAGAVQAERALDDARHDVEAQQAALARWVKAAYMDGALSGSSPALYTLLNGGSTDAAASARTWLEHAGADRLRVLTALRGALAARDSAAGTARHAADLAEAAAAQASAASGARDAVLARHRARLAGLEGLLAASRDAADRADAQAGRLARAWASTRTAAAGLRAPAPAGPGGADCPGGDVSGYPNGQLPTSALCPLPDAPGELLRPDAAAAFRRLSADFRARFGRPLCVTDAYRSYAEQVRVRAARGTWAAVPGRSNHGWGIAVDLCGGVEDFDSPAHAWLVVNGPLLGWYHPAWARRGGSLPEPWHWEFAGQGP